MRLSRTYNVRDQVPATRQAQTPAKLDFLKLFYWSICRTACDIVEKPLSAKDKLAAGQLWDPCPTSLPLRLPVQRERKVYQEGSF